MAATLAAGLRALADAVESQPELLSHAADAMSEDFMTARLPPATGQASQATQNAHFMAVPRSPQCLALVKFRVLTYFKLSGILAQKVS